MDRQEGARAALAEFIKKNGITLRAAAESLGTSKTSLILWLRGEQRPRPPYRQAIAIWTGGKVPADSWETEEERAVVTAVRPYRPATAAPRRRAAGGSR